MKSVLFSGLICTAALLAAPAALASERLEDGEKAYARLCASCHESGAAGAPMTGSPEDWENRSDLWDGVLLEHAEKGYLNMPARGSSEHATDYDISVAAEYMLTITHPDRPAD